MVIVDVRVFRHSACKNRWLKLPLLLWQKNPKKPFMLLEAIGQGYFLHTQKSTELHERVSRQPNFEVNASLCFWVHSVLVILPLHHTVTQTLCHSNTSYRHTHCVFHNLTYYSSKLLMHQMLFQKTVYNACQHTAVLWEEDVFRANVGFLSFKIDLVKADGQPPQMKGYVICVCWIKYFLLFSMQFAWLYSIQSTD